MFEKNEGALDRGIRAALGAGLLTLAAAGLATGTARPLSGVLALGGTLMLFTAASGSCLLYRLAGVDTRATR